MYNFQNICRTCSCQGELRSLFVADPLVVANMLTEIVDIKVIKGDNFPQNICIFCLEKLKSAYLFKKQCQDIHLKFERYLQSIADNFNNVDCKEEVKEENFEQKTNTYSTSTNDDVFNSSIKEEERNEDDDSNQSDWNPDDDMPNSPTIEPDVNIFSESEDSKKRTKSSRRRKVECTVCHKLVIHLPRHMQTHSKEENPFKCEICNVEILRTNYSRHLKTHKGARPHLCTVCGRGFRDNYSLGQHFRTHSGETPFKCTLCDRSFKQQSQLKIHSNKHNCTGELGGKKPDESGKLYEPDEIECEECNKKFRSKETLSRHKLLHGEKSYLCNHCGKEFYSKPSLNLHIRTHTGEKPYKCTTCDKAFSQACSLKSHQIVHTGEKPFKCSTCEKAFSFASVLRTHQKTHTDEEKSFMCTFCGKLLASKLSLKGHQLIHTGDKPFTCNICYQSFRQQPHLKNHLRTHTGEKPYKCTLCEKTFAENKSLTVHMRIHTGETPYICTICNKGFYDLSNLKKHRKYHKIPEDVVVQS